MNFSDAQLIIFLYVIGIFIFINQTGFLFRINHRKHIRVWRRVAEKAGLEFKSGSFASLTNKGQPGIQGQFLEREIKISAETKWKLNFKYALLTFVVSIDNPSTMKLPAGAFVILKEDPRYNHPFYFYRDLSRTTSSEKDEIKNKFFIRSVPINLVNHLLREESAVYLLLQPGVFSFLINKNKLTYTLSGFVGEEDLMLEILETLCGLANSFDRFARNWF